MVMVYADQAGKVSQGDLVNKKIIDRGLPPIYIYSFIFLFKKFNNISNPLRNRNTNITINKNITGCTFPNLYRAIKSSIFDII